MKVCIINNIYPPYDRGGAEQVVVSTVEGLRAAGHEVVVLTSSPKGEEVSDDKGVRIYRTKPRNIFFYTNAHNHNGIVRFLWHIIDMFNMSTARWVKQKLEEEQPDVVHTHNLMGLSFMVPRIIRKLGTRHVHTVHDVQLVEPSAMILKEKEHSWRYNGIHTRLYTSIMKRLMGSPEVVISPSQFLRDFYKTRGFFATSRFEITRNPVTFEVREPVQKSLDEPFKFLYLGQIEYHKGILLLLETFAKASKEYDIDAELHIVGDGSLFSGVQLLASHHTNIVVHGRKDRSELPALFAQMDMTVVPSLCYENSPTVIFESFAFGLPVLASNSEGIAELIREGENGVAFAAGEQRSLMEKMKWCVDNRSQIVEMSKKTNLSLQGLSQKEYIGRLVSLYSSSGSK